METNKKTAEQRLEWKQIRKQQSKVVDAKKGCWKCGHILQRWDGKQHRDDKVLLSYTDRTTLLPLSTLWPLVPPHNTKRRQNSSTTDGLTDGRGAESGHSSDGTLKAAAAATQQRISTKDSKTTTTKGTTNRQGLGVIKPGVNPGVNPGAKLEISFLVNLSPKF